MEQSKKELLITHLVDAPRELVFDAWTDPEHLKHWYAPDGCTIEFKSILVKEGGSYHSCIHDPVHGDCWVKGIYKEVNFPEKLIFSVVMTNVEGQDIRSREAGKPDDWPEETLTTVIFSALGNKTNITIHQTVEEEKAKLTGAYQSWIKMFNRLNKIVSAQTQS